jgi:hypothetical protein
MIVDKETRKKCRITFAFRCKCPIISSALGIPSPANPPERKKKPFHRMKKPAAAGGAVMLHSYLQGRRNSCGYFQMAVSLAFDGEKVIVRDPW